MSAITRALAGFANYLVGDPSGEAASMRDAINRAVEEHDNLMRALLLMDLRDGDPVYYYPDGASKKKYAAVVDGFPRILGGHTPVVRLREVESRYAADCHQGSNRTTVPAAAMWCLERRASGMGDSLRHEP
jgi:hypothetical protein